MEQKILVIGAGYAGVLTAKKLAKRFKKNEHITITIVDKNPFHTMLTELHEVAANRVDEDSIKIDLQKVFAGRKVKVVLDTIEKIDLEGKTAVGKRDQYRFDYLVLAAGSQPTFFGVEGAAENAFQLWSYEDAVVLKEHIHTCFRNACRETDPDEKNRLLTFFIVGAGLTGVEMAGELAEYVPILCEKFNIPQDQVHINMIDILPRVTPILPEKLSHKIENRLKKMNVSLRLNTNVKSIGRDFIEICCRERVERHCSGTVIWTAGIESSDITCSIAKNVPSEKRGRIKTDAYLRSVDNDHVYVVGDNMFYIPRGDEQPVPQMVENCEQSAEVAAHNIYSAITGKVLMTEYKPSFHGIMVSVGGRYGVARVGTPKHMVNLPSFFAMLSKHFINIVYFAQVLGWNKIASYLKHEFFTIRNNRSFLGGHFSNKTPSFLLMPLRVWLGLVWIFEGVMKIVEGWLKAPKLTAFFTSANDWFNAILVGVPKGVEANSAATGTADEVGKAVGTKLFDIDILGLLHAIFVSGKDLSSSTLNDYAFKINIPILNTLLDRFVLSSHDFQIFMQVVIVMVEILIGLAFVGGLFTTPASIVSLVLQLMFITTTGIYLGTFWMIFAAIALLFCAGRTLGLDYYAMPYLKKWWKRHRLVRKSYLYHD